MCFFPATQSKQFALSKISLQWHLPTYQPTYLKPESVTWTICNEIYWYWWLLLICHVFKYQRAPRGLFSIFCLFNSSVVLYRFLQMSGFEPWSSDLGSISSATTSVLRIKKFRKQNQKCFCIQPYLFISGNI